MRFCVSCKKRRPVAQLFRFNLENAELRLLTSSQTSGRSGWVCQIHTCITNLINNPKCSYRSLREKARCAKTFVKELQKHLFERICSTLIQLYRSGTITLGKNNIIQNIDKTLFLVTHNRSKQSLLKDRFSNIDVVLFKETPKLMSIALHKRSNGVISIQPHKEAVHFKEMLLLWSKLFCNDHFTENKIQPLPTEMLIQGSVV